MNDENKNLTAGVYIPDENGTLHTHEEWAQREDPTTADGVVLATPYWFIAIDRQTPDKCMDWIAARHWARSRKIYGMQCDLFDRYQGLHIFDNLKEINACLKTIGGDIIPSSWHWTKDDVKHDPRCAFVVDMCYGHVLYSSKNNTLCVRAVSAFHFEDFRF